MPSKQGILKPCDEVKMKREVEALLMKSKIEYHQMRARQSQEKSTSLTLPSDRCHRQVSTGRLPVVSGGEDCFSLTPQEPETLMSPGLIEFRADLLQSPPSSVLPPDEQMSVSHSQEGVLQSPAEERTSRNPPVSVPSPVVYKPAIASLTGTTKAVSMSKRPQPPPKPRSERPPTGSKLLNTRIRSVLSPAHKISVANTDTQLHGPLQGSSPSLRPYDSSSESNSSDDSGSDQSACGQSKVRRRKKRRTRLRHQPKSDKPPTGQKTRTPILHSVKSATELLEEARNIAGRETESQEAEASMASAKSLVRTGHRTVDEIIASLQCGTVSFSASDDMIKELMKQILGDGYIADNEVSPVYTI